MSLQYHSKKTILFLWPPLQLEKYLTLKKEKSLFFLTGYNAAWTTVIGRVIEEVLSLPILGKGSTRAKIKSETQPPRLIRHRIQKDQAVFFPCDFHMTSQLQELADC